MSDVWPVVADVLVPSAAVLVSSGIAIFLANRERKAAQRERVRTQVEESLRGVLSRLSYFVSADPVEENWRFDGVLQDLRVEALIVQSLPQKEYGGFGDWLASELQRGLGVIASCTERIGNDKPTREERVLHYMEPVRLWVMSTSNLIVLWMRGDVSDDRLLTLSDAMAQRGWKTPEGEDDTSK